ncbi:ABC transporter permease [Parenemella sanctibonifatiensis]|uniref:ABC transporter permease n=1 Tax=Parenemella sanctibonifatiensis TaxID=2016505 RepID=A0A255EHA4_9ACTN|nr:ABC transporter permease [Parenemella sanctibonifatiensis]OYN90924.1 ABC transporter permease [Parenemella sanctibonifatiensis]
MRLARTIVGKVAILLASLAAASVLVFALCSLLPGDVALVLLGQNASADDVARLRQQLGLDRPFWQRYADWAGGLATGDLGRSQVSGIPVADTLAYAGPVTVSLVLGGMILALVVAVPAGMHAAVRRRHLDGLATSMLSQIGLALPAFWLGLILSILFGPVLRWLPANGYVPLNEDPVAWARHLVLPVIALGVVQGAILTRYVRSAFLEVLHEDYLRTALAGGWRLVPALLRHGMRNAALSVMTILGLQLATLLVGAIVVEQVFVMPGLGSQLLLAVQQRDLISVQSLVMVLVACVLVLMTVVDLAQLVLDPRQRDRRPA